MENLAYIGDSSDQVQLGTTKRRNICCNYEEALEKAQVGRFHYLLLLVCGLGFMSASVEIIGMTVVMFSADCDLKLTVSQQGLLGSMGYLGVVLSSHAMGFSADTWGRVKTIRISLMLSVCTSLASVFSINFYMLAACRFCTGFFMSASQSCVFTLIGEYHGPKTRINHLTILSSFLVIGLIYIQGMAILILPLKIFVLAPWRLILLVHTLPSIFCSIGLFFIPESPKFLLDQGKPEECHRILQKVYSLNTGNSEYLYPCDSVEAEQMKVDSIDGIGEKLRLMLKQTVKILNKEHLLNTLKFNFISFSMTLVGAGLYMWLPAVLNYLNSYRDEQLSVCDIVKLVERKSSNLTFDEKCAVEKDMSHFKILLLINVAFLVFYVVTAILTTIVGRRLKTAFGRHLLKIFVLVTWYAAGAVFAFLIYWSNEFILSIISLAMFAQIANWIGIVSGIATEYYPSQMNAMAICVLMMISRLGVAIGSSMVGPLLPLYCESMFFIGGIVMCVAIVIVCCFPRGVNK